MGAVPTTSTTITKSLETILPKNVTEESPVLLEKATPKRHVSNGTEGVVEKQPANTVGANNISTPQRHVSKGAESAATSLRRHRFEKSFPALPEGTQWRKEVFARQHELLEMKMETEAMRHELLSAQLAEAQTKMAEAQTRARIIALLEEEVLKNKLAK